MWYQGETEYSGGGVGHAISTDGVHWVKDAANPVILRESSDALWVILLGSTYYMYLESPSGISRATSLDGSDWDISGFDLPVLMPGPSGSWDALDIKRLVAIDDGGMLRGWYSGSDGTSRRSGHATCDMP
jgi:hypothetical protein